MAPSTPPPPSRVGLAALTIASAASVVMSATQTSSRAEPIAAPASEEILAIVAATSLSLSRLFRLRFGAQVDRALHADIVEMRVQKTPRCALAADAKHVEEVVIGRQPAERVEMRTKAVEHDAMHVDAAIFSRPYAARQPALVDQPRDEVDGAIFAKQRGVERNLVDSIHDLARRHRGRLPHQWIYLHHEDVLGCGRAKERKDHRIAEIAAVPVGHAIDFDSAEQQRQAG